MGIFLIIAGIVVAAILALIQIKISRRPLGPKSVAEFKGIRRLLRQVNMTEKIINYSIRDQKGRFAPQVPPDVPLLAKSGWILQEPVTLDRIELRYTQAANEGDLDKARKKLIKYWPRDDSGQHLPTYHEAVDQFDPPKLWFNGASYRLLDVTPKDDGLALNLTRGWYWDSFDTTEPLLFEAARNFARSQGREIDGRYRKWLEDPYDFSQRCAIPGVNTLTVRQGEYGSTFYMHDRTDVATAAGTVHVIPAGEFQPSHDSPQSAAREVDLWLTIVREYVEEFLGHKEARDRSFAPVDFERQWPYSRLYEARKGGRIGLYFLGIGLYPLTWKPEILTVCIFDADSFDEIFPCMVPENEEGKLDLPFQRRMESGIYQGWPFDDATVTEFIHRPSALPAGRACLALAWKHQHTLGLS
ncbi:hypothetical protein M2271_006167 [Streptomyces sp. LBL]|uniref:hypothetical protein n=1 Tax=Streptomyces sp. LBL TaxID=2940562 RepID=UPI00247592B9|nr:hypothetical protein [Streptomyces sp. LBL]MDH6628335.1 hypothetical protein [Streptomyces sp. LBL]